MECLLGIDVGPSFIKAVAYDVHGNVVAYSDFPTKISYSIDKKHPDWVCWEPDVI